MSGDSSWYPGKPEVWESYTVEERIINAICYAKDNWGIIITKIKLNPQEFSNLRMSLGSQIYWTPENNIRLNGPYGYVEAFRE